MYGTILPPPVWKDFSRLTRRGCVVYTPCCVQPWNLCSLPALFPSISSGIRVPLRFWACKLDETGSLLSSVLILRVSLMSRNKYYVWSCLNCSVRSWSVQVFSRQRNRRLIENSSRFLTKFIIFKDTRFWDGIEERVKSTTR